MSTETNSNEIRPETTAKVNSILRNALSAFRRGNAVDQDTLDLALSDLDKLHRTELNDSQYKRLWTLINLVVSRNTDLDLASVVGDMVGKESQIEKVNSMLDRHAQEVVSIIAATRVLQSPSLKRNTPIPPEVMSATLDDMFTEMGLPNDNTRQGHINSLETKQILAAVADGKLALGYIPPAPETNEL